MTNTRTMDLLESDVTKSAVMYSHLPVKTVSVPDCMERPVLDGTVRSACWAQAAFFEDFLRYKAEGAPTARTRVKAMRHGTDLYLGIVCQEPLEITRGSAEQGMSIWNGDMVELFFGGLEPEGWCLQLAVSATGGRFCDNGKYEDWDYCTHLEEHGWSAELRIPLSMLKLSDGGCGFNLCRQRLKAREFVTWGPVQKSFHEPENFGQLLFCDYGTAALLRLGQAVSAPITRDMYEELATRCSHYACDVIHGPYLTNPTATSISVNWATAGRCGAWVELKAEGDTEWRRVASAYTNGVTRYDLVQHYAELTDLVPGTRYVYRLAQRTLLDAKDCLSEGGSFKTFSQLDTHCRFALYSDIHGDSDMLRKLWRSVQDRPLDFCVNLGDMLSAINGPEDFYKGFLDAETDLFARHTPIAVVRGNHDLCGFYAGGFFSLLPHPSGRTYYAFQQGPAMFIVLDGAKDSPHLDDFFDEQRQWLAELVQQEAYRKATFRIVLAHFPLCDETNYCTQVMERITQGLLDGTADIPTPHLWIGGHWHSYFRIDPHHLQFMAALDGFHSQQLPDLPFTVVANDGPGEGGYEGSILLTEIHDQTLHLTVWGPEGEKIDDVTITAH